MASEYLRKSVADRRTGANLIGISVDTSNMREFSPIFKTGFDELEKFARETDEMKIETEKKRLKLEIEQNMLNFKNDYLKDPTIYNSQEKWDETSKLYEQERKKALSKIAESKYLSSDEKTLYSKEMQNAFTRNWAEPIQKRNGAVIKERLNETMTNIDMITSIASMGNFYDTEVLPRAISDIKAEYKELIKHGMSTESDMNYTLAQRISMIESSLFLNKIESDVIYNSNLTPEQKREEIKKAVEFLGDEERINGIIETFGKENKFDENTQKYLSLSLKEGYLKAKNTADKLIYRLEKDKKNLLEDNSKKVQEAYYKRNTSDYINYKYGVKNVSTSQLLNNEETLKLVTDIPAEDFGDSKKGLAFPFITDGINTALNGQIADRKKNPNYTLNEVYKPIYDFATENCGEKAGYTNRRKALIIDYALKNGIEPDVLLKGENNPDYFKVSNIMSIGTQENKDNLNIRNLVEDDETFDKLSMAFSPIKSVGDLMATNYILGKAKARGQEKMLLERPKMGFGTVMKGIPSDEYIREIKIAKEITLNRTPYRYVNYNEKIEKKEILVPKNAKQSEMFGG